MVYRNYSSKSQSSSKVLPRSERELLLICAEQKIGVQRFWRDLCNRSYHTARRREYFGVRRSVSGVQLLVDQSALGGPTFTITCHVRTAHLETAMGVSASRAEAKPEGLGASPPVTGVWAPSGVWGEIFLNSYKTHQETSQKFMAGCFLWKLGVG